MVIFKIITHVKKRKKYKTTLKHVHKIFNLFIERYYLYVVGINYC